MKKKKITFSPLSIIKQAIAKSREIDKTHQQMKNDFDREWGRWGKPKK